MTYLPSLIKKIDEFSRLADSFTRMKRIAQDYKGHYMPDDPEDEDAPESTGQPEAGPGLYSEIVRVANSLSGEANDFKNEDIANEILLIADLYKKAVEINGGYHQLNRAISVALSNIDSLIDDGSLDEDVREIAENILEETAADLRQRAKTSVSQQIDEASAMKELRAVQQAFNSQEARQEMSEQKSVYEKGKPGAETGHNIGKAQAPPETPEKYGKEIARLKDGLINDPSLRNPISRSNVEQLIQTLEQLVSQIPTVIALRDQLKITPDDPEKQEEFNKATALLDQLRTTRRLLKRRLNSFLKDKEIEDLEARSVRAKTPQEKKWLEEKINLERLRKSNDYKKRKEIKYRKDLVNSIGALDKEGDYVPLAISPEMAQKLQEGIDAGRAEKVSKVDYDAKQSLDRAIQHGKRKDEKGIVEFEPRQKGKRGGGGRGEKLNNYDLEVATFSGLIDKLGEKINTAVHVARLGVTQEKNKTHNALKPYVEAISKAIQKKDNNAKYVAIKALKQQMVDWASRVPAVRALEKNVRLLPYFNKFKEEFKVIGKMRDENGNWTLTENDRAYIAVVIRDAERLTSMYAKYYQQKGQMELFFDSAISHFAAVIHRIKNETGVSTFGGKANVE